MGKSYSISPEEVHPIETRYRRIVTPIPAPESVPVLETLREFEPRSMSGQPPVVWDHAQGVNVYDAYGNRWLDFSSGVLVTGAGHAHPAVTAGIRGQLEKPLLHNYCFPSEIRARLAKKIADVSPAPLKKVFLLTTGAETTECALKLIRTQGKSRGAKVVITFEGSFHGRTLGAQMMGGMPALKEWISTPDPDIHQVPFPGDPRCGDRSFDVFTAYLKEKGIAPGQVCGVVSETYQGASAAFMPVEYARALRAWCDENGALLVFDEVQAGFGRTGTMFGFQHYGVLPDLYCLGKGISSSLPLSAVVGKPDIMDQYEPGTMTSTHTGNPLSCAAALAGIQAIRDEGMIENAARMEPVLAEKLGAMKDAFEQVGFLCGKGLVWGMHIVKAGGTEPDGDAAFQIVKRCFQKGLLFFAPVGPGGATIKISPPLCITKDAVDEGCAVLEESIREVTEK